MLQKANTQQTRARAQAHMHRKHCRICTRIARYNADKLRRAEKRTHGRTDADVQHAYDSSANANKQHMRTYTHACTLHSTRNISCPLIQKCSGKGALLGDQRSPGVQHIQTNRILPCDQHIIGRSAHFRAISTLYTQGLALCAGAEE